MIFESKKKEIVSWWKSDSKWSSSQEVSYTKFLGLYFEENLSWKYHISHVTMKMSKMTGILAKTRPYLPLRLRLQMLYMTMIYPYLNECYFTEVIPLNNIWWALAIPPPQCLHFPSKFDCTPPPESFQSFQWSPLLGSQLRLIPPFVLLKIKWSPKSPTLPPPPPQAINNDRSLLLDVMLGRHICCCYMKTCFFAYVKFHCKEGLTPNWQYW